MQQCPELAAARLHRRHASVLPSHLSSCLISLCSAPSLNFSARFSSRPDPGHPGPDQRERAPDGRHADGEGGQCQLGGGLQSPDNHTPPHGARTRGEQEAPTFGPTMALESCAVVARGSRKHSDSNPAVVSNEASAHLSFNIFAEKASEALPVAPSTFHRLAHRKRKLFFMFIQPW